MCVLKDAEVDVLQLPLGKFNEWINLGGKELQIYSKVRGVCLKPLSDAAPRKEYVGWLESRRRVQQYTNKGVA